MEREELNTPKMLRRVRLDLNTPAELAIFKAMQEVEKAGADVRLTEATMLLAKAKDCVADFIDGVEQSIPPAEGAEQLTKEQFTAIIEDSVKDIWYGRRSINPVKEQTELLVEKLYPLMNKPQPIAEGAEEILASIVESLGEPINIHNHVFEIRPYTVEHKTEWWIFHKEVGSGEPLKQWLGKFATLHAQKIADKMVSERLREELIKYDKYIGSRGWIDNYEDWAAITSVDEYLKSREQ